MWTSIHGNPILCWVPYCWSNTTTTQIILDNYAFTFSQCPHYNKTRLLFPHPLHCMSFITINSERLKLLKSTFIVLMSELTSGCHGSHVGQECAWERTWERVQERQRTFITTDSKVVDLTMSLQNVMCCWVFHRMLTKEWPIYFCKHVMKYTYSTTIWDYRILKIL